MKTTVVVGLPFFLVIHVLLLSGCSENALSSAADGREFPQKAIKVIVPFSAGGGSDTFARIIQQAIDEQELLPNPIVVINVPGAGGTIGSRRTKNARPDGYTIMQLHDGILTSKYSGIVHYGPEAFTPIAATGESIMIIGVGENSPYQSLQELMKDVADRPDEVVFASNIGAPSQYAGLMLEKTTPGARFRYSQTGDGAKRFAGLHGGHTDVSAFSLAEYIQFRPSGLKALALLGKSRHPEARDVPTALEQGFDVVSTNMIFWWAPIGTPPERIAVISEALERAMQSDQVRERLAQLKTDPVFLSGSELEEELKTRSELIASVSVRPTLELPDFPRWIAGAVAVFAVLALTFNTVGFGRSGDQSLPEPSNDSTRTDFVSWRNATLTLLTTVVYVIVLSMNAIGYIPCTLAFMIFVGLCLSPTTRRMLVMNGVLALILSVSLHLVFTRIFVIDLP
ncbi:tripartite tricarboxylate transporter substrate binding protein [Thalassoglobus neptunius]|uniref:tripartite tricarboxylate transporter substrate binding protein n=1 Tax=Thalassoglobus neptunius TaxID=1938619 RepID=UPI0018D1FDA8|nr:tripartite tricarboxylate transporter substrate-binding protein [Thalassoglobus neptunius]